MNDISTPRFFTDYADPYNKYLLILWIVLWKWVDPIIMFLIFVSSVVLEIVKPLTYSVYSQVSLLGSGCTYERVGVLIHVYCTTES